MCKRALTVDDVLAMVDGLAPFRLAESWDNVGLQAGDPDRPVKRIAVALEVTASAVREARARRADLLIVHHPLIFKPLKSASRATPVGALLSDLIAADIALIAAHTNLDASPCGTNAALASLLKLKDVGPLIDLDPSPAAACKFVVFVPSGHERAVIEAIHRAGGAAIGDYDHCSFRSPGVGSYRPLAGADPYDGTVGRHQEAEELRIEAEVPRGSLAGVLRETLSAHPYEEVAYDVYPRERVDAGFSNGLTGRLPRPVSLSSLARRLRRLLPGDEPMGLVGDPKRSVGRVAVFTGAGSMAVERWRGRADALITGEIGHHTARDAEAKGLALIAAGHFATERPVVPFLAERLRVCEAIGAGQAEVIEIEDEHSPFVRVS